MTSFQHIDAHSVDDAVTLLSQHGGTAAVIAGGTDLLGLLKTGATLAPQLLVNIKTISGLGSIQADSDGLTIGALTKLAAVVHADVIRAEYPILALAAESVAMPQIRNMGTIGGNLAQETRCWYFRYPHAIGGRIMCRRKGEGACLAVKGDNRYHAIFGGKKCFAVCPSDMAVALAALDAQIRINGPNGERSVTVTDFYHPLGNALAPDELITEIRIPKPVADNRQRFIKHRVRDAVDFATVSVGLVACMDGEIVTGSRIVLGAVAPGPYRAVDAEAALAGRAITSETAECVADAAVNGAVPLSKNGYKVEMAKALLKRALLA